MAEIAIVLCRDPLAPREPDPAFQDDADAAGILGLRALLIDHDTVEAGNAAHGLRNISFGQSVHAVYRGWMLRAASYGRLYEGLLERGIQLLNSPAQYERCHHLPAVQPYVGHWSAEMTSVAAGRMRDPRALSDALSVFGDGPVVLKDWVKSQAAGYWAEACFIPRASDAHMVSRVVARFIELQGDALVGGLVFRRYYPLARIAGQPEEWRAFVLDGCVIACWPRFPASQDALRPPGTLLHDIAAALPSRFAAFDLARRVDGGWLLIETGDGQVSSVPDGARVSDILSPVAVALSRGGMIAGQALA